jgi:hypothetical protein
MPNNKVPVIAIYSYPSARMRVIVSLTHCDRNGKRWYRETILSKWKRLRYQIEFDRLNEIVGPGDVYAK